jgi:hypothetical protein
MSEEKEPYAELKDDLLRSIDDLLGVAGKHATNDDGRRDVIELCMAHITENIEDLATTTEQAFAIIDEIAAELKRQWQEMREDGNSGSRAAKRK